MCHFRLTTTFSNHCLGSCLGRFDAGETSALLAPITAKTDQISEFCQVDLTHMTFDDVIFESQSETCTVRPLNPLRCSAGSR